MLTLVGVLLGVTVAVAREYYKLIRRAQLEYVKAREVVEDVVLSFNRELKRETEKLDVIAYKIESNTSKIEASIKKTENIEKKIAPIEEQLGAITKENLDELAKETDVKAKISLLEENDNRLRMQITELDEKLQKLVMLPEAKIEPVIPIRRDKAMASLTDTEIAVLEFLLNEGAKTAPEIKQKVQLSREHTARLMKKLYEEGYLERETGKIPFKYSVKKEMEKLLSKPETTQA